MTKEKDICPKCGGEMVLMDGFRPIPYEYSAFINCKDCDYRPER